MGTAAVSVIFTPSDPANFNSAIASVSVVVLPTPLSVSAASATRPYGAANPVFAGTLVGLVNGESITATYSASATANSPVGTYPIVASLTDVNNRLSNYSASITYGTLTIAPAPLTVTAANATRVYGQNNPVFTGSIVGLVIGDNISANYSCTAAPASLPGNYTILLCPVWWTLTISETITRLPSTTARSR